MTRWTVDAWWRGREVTSPVGRAAMVATGLTLALFVGGLAMVLGFGLVALAGALMLAALPFLPVAHVGLRYAGRRGLVERVDERLVVHVDRSALERV